MFDLKIDNEKKVSTFKYVFSIALFVVILLMWLFWETSSSFVLLTGVAVLTVILRKYMQDDKEGEQREGAKFYE